MGLDNRGLSNPDWCYGGRIHLMNKGSMNISRFELRIPDELLERLRRVAYSKKGARINPRSGKPEVTPTILEAIQIGLDAMEAEASTANTDREDIERLIVQRISQAIDPVWEELSTLKKQSVTSLGLEG